MIKQRKKVARKAAIYLSHRHSGRSLREIGSVFNIGESTVSQASRRFASEINESRMLRRKMARLQKKLDLSSV